jgi:hypothetical protein
MRLEDVLYFSENYRFEELDLENTSLLIDAFVDRVESFYFRPALSLSDINYSFAKGTLTLAAIDFIGLFFYGTNNSDRIKKFCCELKSVKDQDPTEIAFIIKTINESFRNGLIHEGRIKKLGQFAPDIDRIIEIRENFAVINPTILLQEVQELFHAKVNVLRSSKEKQFQFKKQFKNAFEDEIKLLKA